MPARALYIVAIGVVLIVGIASRLLRTGQPLIDKYLGDALYAVLVYLALSLAWRDGPVVKKAAFAGAIMLVIETFQLTRIPARLAQSDSLLLRLFAVILGTAFSWRDIAAYAAGIALIALFDRYVLLQKKRIRDAER
jgi:hypothetical protein